MSAKFWINYCVAELKQWMFKCTDQLASFVEGSAMAVSVTNGSLAVTDADSSL